MICFICENEFKDLYILVRHYKLQHSLNTHSNFKCMEETCSQSFPNLSSFKKHMIKKHVNDNGTSFQQNRSTIDADTKIDNIELNNTTSNVNVVKSDSNNSSAPKRLFSSDKNENKLDINNCLKSIQTAAINFTLSLHAKNNFTKKDVFMVQEILKEYIMDSLIGSIQLILKNRIHDYDKEYIDLDEALNILKDPFKICNTDHKLNCWLQNHDLSKNLTEFTINKNVTPICRKGEFVYEEKKITGVMLPLGFQMKKVLEKYSFQKALHCKGDLSIKQNSDFSSFLESRLWQKKIKKYSNSAIVIPYFLYVDDFEINDPLGSHATSNSVTALYYSFPSIFENSKLENIFLAALISSNNVKSFGNDECLRTVVREISSLENEGITIQFNHEELKVYPVLGLLLGDNLALNNILGFARSFSSNYYCRFCKMHKKKCQSCFDENELLLRNIDNYNVDLVLNNASETGIQENSIFNTIDSFHVTKNFSVDMMHDIFEGICHYNLCHIIIYFTETVRLFSLEQLNCRKKYFNYGRTEIANISVNITSQHINKRHLKMSAREMMCFVHFLPLIIGDLIPENDPVWNFFLEFLQIIDILLCYTISPESLNLLNLLIRRHLEMYCKLFQDTLKPKHHNLLHYPTVIKYSGSPRNYWCFKFESKHKELKLYAHSVNSRVNVPLTLTKKYQLKFANQIVNSTQETNTFSVLEKNEIKSKYYDYITSKMPIKKTFVSYNEIKFKNIDYKANDYFYSFSCEKSLLYKILEFILTSEKKMFILCEETEVEYNQHYDGYEINSSVITSLKLIEIETVSGPPIHVHSIGNSKILVRLKEFFV